MTDNTMVERLALIFAQHGDHLIGDDGPSSASWDDFSPREQLVATAAARAAIEAMMEPTEEMLSAWYEREHAWSHGGWDGPYYHGIWQAMISASLKGEGE